MQVNTRLVRCPALPFGKVQISWAESWKQQLNNPDEVKKCLYTIEDAAVLLSLSPWTIRRHQAQGNIKVVNIGRAIRIPATELDRIATEGLGSLAQAA